MEGPGDEATPHLAKILRAEFFGIRPGKLDLLFRISHLLDLHVGGRSLFIICYYKMLYVLSKFTALRLVKMGVSLLGMR